MRTKGAGMPGVEFLFSLGYPSAAATEHGGELFIGRNLPAEPADGGENSTISLKMLEGLESLLSG
jgi:hypothetical protein